MWKNVFASKRLCSDCSWLWGKNVDPKTVVYSCATCGGELRVFDRYERSGDGKKQGKQVKTRVYFCQGCNMLKVGRELKRVKRRAKSRLRK